MAVNPAPVNPLTPDAGNLARGVIIDNTVQVANVYEDNQRAQFVRKRQHVWWGFGVLEVVTAGLLAFSMYEHQPTSYPLPDPMNDPVVGAIAVYLVGALVGVFNWAFQESTALRTVEDFGLFKAQLLLSTGLSGVAALGGVIVTVLFAGSLDPSVILPRQATATPVTTSVTQTVGAPGGSPSVVASPGALQLRSAQTARFSVMSAAAPDPHSADAPQSTPTPYHVIRGDTMWDISGRYLGDPRRWPTVFAANVGKQSSDGHELRDGRLIWPELELELPYDQPTETVSPEPTITPTWTPTSTPTPTPSPSPIPTPTPTTVPGVQATITPTPTGGQIERQFIAVGDPFTLAKFPLAVLLAIIYGFSPRLLVDRLTQSSNDLAKQFKSIQAA